jgi:hypothetical protein
VVLSPEARKIWVPDPQSFQESIRLPRTIPSPRVWRWERWLWWCYVSTHELAGNKSKKDNGGSWTPQRQCLGLYVSPRSKFGCISRPLCRHLSSVLTLRELKKVLNQTCQHMFVGFWSSRNGSTEGSIDRGHLYELNSVKIIFLSALQVEIINEQVFTHCPGRID